MLCGTKAMCTIFNLVQIAAVPAPQQTVAATVQYNVVSLTLINRQGPIYLSGQSDGHSQSILSYVCTLYIIYEQLTKVGFPSAFRKPCSPSS